MCADVGRASRHRLLLDRKAQLGTLIPLAALAFFGIDLVVVYLTFEP
jgi:hypothetical protein